MLIGYVSDENYSALADAQIEFERGGKSVAVVRSSPRGAICAEIPPGNYRVTLAKAGFGSKSVSVEINSSRPHQFRLLSDNLLGYVWPKWAKSGEPGEFRVHSIEPYKLTLWRYGLKKEFVKLIGWFDEHAPRAVLQITPDGDYTPTGVEWNRHGYARNFSAQKISAPERSGLYYFHVETESGKNFSFPWVVAPKKPQAQIAVLASTNTWNAYNNFGGRNNYINPTKLLAQPTVNSRLDLPRYSGESMGVWQSPDGNYAPLSFDRPEPFNHIPKETEVTDPIRGRQGCHLAPAEWRLLGWLEREKFSCDFYSDHQLHGGQLNLDAYKVLILSTHPEYWSREMYLRVKKWVFERGGKLLYLGGNGVNCEVEFSDDATMRCKTWLPSPDGSLKLVDPKTKIPYESRWHFKLESEANLLGVVFSEAGISTAAPYRVVDDSHWIFAGTGLKNGDVFGAESLHERIPGGASGHETDKRSVSSPANTILLARGMNANDGGAEMIYFDTKSGGAVFSVGSITWPASVLVDKNVSCITRNVLEKFLGKKVRRRTSKK